MEILTAERNPSGREGLWRGALKENKHTQAKGKGEIVYMERKHKIQSVEKCVCMYEGDKTE